MRTRIVRGVVRTPMGEVRNKLVRTSVRTPEGGCRKQAEAHTPLWPRCVALHCRCVKRCKKLFFGVFFDGEKERCATGKSSEPWLAVSG